MTIQEILKLELHNKPGVSLQVSRIRPKQREIWVTLKNHSNNGDEIEVEYPGGKKLLLTDFLPKHLQADDWSYKTTIKFEAEMEIENFRNFEICHLPSCTTFAFVFDKKYDFDFSKFAGKIKLTIETVNDNIE